MLIPFNNEPFTNFEVAANRDAMLAALDRVKAQLGLTYPLIVDGQQITTAELSQSINPAFPEEVVGRFAKATVGHADQAIRAADEAFPGWSRLTAAERSDYLFRAAAIMRRRKFEFAAWMVYEVSKSWAEADADVAEAIDFMEYYGREMLRLASPQPLVPVPGEDNQLRYIPLGVGVIIPPWNFPLAITVGMTTAALVAGNTVVLKPASAAPTIAAKFVSLLNDDCRLPPGVLNFLPGSGGAIGDALVDHPRTRFIAFTGSKEVGLRIFERAARRQPGQN